MFEQASRKKYRFTSVRGQLNSEQLWDVPLTSKDGFDLDSVARTLYNEVNEQSQTSFVRIQSAPTAAMIEAEEKLELVKHVIKVKIDERKAAEQAKSRRDERRKLEEILETKKASALGNLSIEDIEKRLAELNV